MIFIDLRTLRLRALAKVSPGEAKRPLTKSGSKRAAIIKEWLVQPVKTSISIIKVLELWDLISIWRKFLCQLQFDHVGCMSHYDRKECMIGVAEPCTHWIRLSAILVLVQGTNYDRRQLLGTILPRWVTMWLLAQEQWSQNLWRQCGP